MSTPKRKDRRHKELIELGRKAKIIDEENRQLIDTLVDVNEQLRRVTAERDHAVRVFVQRRGLIIKLLQRIRAEIAMGTSRALRVMELENDNRCLIQTLKAAEQTIAQLKKDVGEAPKLRRRLQTRGQELSALQTELHKLRKTVEV